MSTSATQDATPPRAGVDTTRRTARVVGALFLVTIFASIPGALLYKNVLHPSTFIVGGGGDTQVALAAFLEVITLIAGIGTAVALFPIVKRQNEGVALGYVACRVLESTVILVGAISLLSIVTLRQSLAGSGGDAATFIVAGKSLRAVHDWTFLMGPAFCAGIGNGLLLGYLMFRSGLVPRGWAILGLIGGTMALITAIAALFGVWEQVSAPGFLMTVPEFIWEGFLGFYLLFKGFKPVPIAAAYHRTDVPYRA